jgi:hypothetical protein
LRAFIGPSGVLTLYTSEPPDSRGDSGDESPTLAVKCFVRKSLNRRGEDSRADPKERDCPNLQTASIGTKTRPVQATVGLSSRKIFHRVLGV